jgi:hypothetical protein
MGVRNSLTNSVGAAIVAGMAALSAQAAVPVVPHPHGNAAIARVALTKEDDALDYIFKLGLLEGHLMVGKELLDAKRAKLALPHFGHPVRELYDDLRPVLNAEKVAPFDVELIALEAAVTKDPNSADTAARFGQVMARVEDARKIVPEALRAQVPFVVKLCANTIEAAAGEYGEAIERGKIENLVEYHDSRGFIAYARKEAQHLAQIAGDSAVIRSLQAIIAKTNDIVGSLMPPAKPRRSVSDYRAIAEEAHKLAQ